MVGLKNGRIRKNSYPKMVNPRDIVGERRRRRRRSTKIYNIEIVVGMYSACHCPFAKPLFIHMYAGGVWG